MDLDVHSAFFCISKILKKISKEMNDMSKRIPELYGSMIFSDRIMRNKLPKDVYKALRKTIENH